MVYIFFIKISFHFPLKTKKKKMSSIEMQTMLTSTVKSREERIKTQAKTIIKPQSTIIIKSNQ